MTPYDRLRTQLVAAVTASKPRIPEAGRLVFRWYLDLSLARSYGPHGPNPISYAEIDAWQRCSRMPVQPHHMDLLRAMDAAWMERARAEVRRAAGGDRPDVLPAVSKEPISPALFDAMFA